MTMDQATRERILTIRGDLIQLAEDLDEDFHQTITNKLFTAYDALGETMADGGQGGRTNVEVDGVVAASVKHITI